MARIGGGGSKALQADIIYGDRRGDRRYRVELELCYRFSTADGTLEAGTGIAHDISRSGVLLESEAPLDLRCSVELVIAWPLRLQNVCPLELVITGETVRIDGRQAAVQTASYRFRTRGVRGFEEQPREAKRLLATA